MWGNNIWAVWLVLPSLGNGMVSEQHGGWEQAASLLQQNHWQTWGMGGMSSPVLSYLCDCTKSAVAARRAACALAILLRGNLQHLLRVHRVPLTR